MHQRFQLSHSDAVRIVDAIRAKLEEQGKGAAIAVVDTLFLRKKRRFQLFSAKIRHFNSKKLGKTVVL